MRNLIDAENGEGWVSHLPSAEKQFAKVNSYIQKAFDKLIKRRRTEEKKNELLQLKERTINSRRSSELLDIIEEAMELTHDLE
jgi:hypothetical protein